MGEILVRRAIDRSRYPKAMMYVDGEGNICKVGRHQALSPEEKAERLAERNDKRKVRVAKSKELRDGVSEARKQAKKEPSVANAKALQVAQEAYVVFKKGA